MSLALTIAGITFGLLISFTWLFSRERKAGRRFILPTVRFALDNVIVTISLSLHRFFVYITSTSLRYLGITAYMLFYNLR
jgi:hypothetical protein